MYNLIQTVPNAKTCFCEFKTPNQRNKAYCTLHCYCRCIFSRCIVTSCTSRRHSSRNLPSRPEITRRVSCSREMTDIV
uniref:Uncharacterized protein n=1 Tax=Ciona intestinalis TaxID=7719 RepID=F6ZM21_CIOIN